MLVNTGSDQAAGLRRMFAESGPRVIELVGGHAGVGRTSVAVYLAAALARIGRRVLLVDLVRTSDVAKAGRYLGIDGEAATHAEPGRAAIAPGIEGLAVLELGQGAHADPHPQSAAGSRAALLREAAARDCVLVSGMTGERVLATEDGRREVIVVLSSEPSSITAAYALVKCMAYETGASRFGVVANRVDSEVAAKRIFHNMACVAQSYLDVKLDLLGAIPSDPCVRQAAAHGANLIRWSDRSPAARAFQHLADRIGRWPEREPPRVLGCADAAGAACSSGSPSAVAVEPT